ncbi:uncharacterized protein LOC130901991 isoform X1 [Diorhabda carinulata]|uniref:uncharacterized protein LOC130901991 isoform X1 n=1 Tax=Diorhabda carinulata TaxID=1163345 RepID=UPI0025A0E692|nr:uncharacterized protein LOC130901991 isoform X1 [Diorhabda carinulata]
MMYDPFMIEEKPKLHEWNTLPPRTKTVECDFKIDKYIRKAQVKKGPSPITWTVSDIAKAGCLLSCPPLKTNFEDEQEMRRVYTLIYDVFRYKNVLTQALNDVTFFQTFPKLSENVQVVWLLLYDLYHRSFNKRETQLAALAHQLFDAYGLSFAENALWTQRIKLAAAIARLRIKNSALTLGELLPPHLKDEKVTEQAQNNPVTCWINLYKTRDTKALCEEIEKYFNIKMISDISRLNQNNFKWDRHCPHIIVFHSSIRTLLAKSNFVKNHILIVQDKSFCLGPATFKKLVTDLELTGCVIQTHINSPRTTAYLASLLAQNEKIKKLLAFSAGRRKEEYENYFNQLGMSNIKLFSDRLIDTPPDATYMEEVVAVFATPPNSYTAVVDPIDLVCSRGGDLSMLEILTETGDTKEAKERIAKVLDEQQKTLRFAMSRPQIQFVLYETHSELDAENKCMVDKALNEINEIAKLQHAALLGQAKTILSSEDKENKEINNNENTNEEAEDLIEEKVQEPNVLDNMPEDEGDEFFLDKINVPDTDIFDNCQLPILCPSESCKGFQKEVCGCFLALLQRKEIIRLDDKYMIKMAENRGLFGSNNNSIKTKSMRSVRRKAEKPEKHEVVRKKLKECEICDPAIPYQEYCSFQKEASEGKLWNRRNERPYIDDTDHSKFYVSNMENSEKKDAMVMHNSSGSSKLLSKLNSAHIRQFVSPFYRQFDILPPIISPVLEARLPTGYSKFSTRFKNMIVQKTGLKRSRYSANKTSNNRFQIQSDGDLKKDKRKRNVCSQSTDNFKNKKMESIVARVCIPTQSVLMKRATKKMPVDIQNQENIKKARPSALECSKRIFFCKLCKKRNPED